MNNILPKFCFLCLCVCLLSVPIGAMAEDQSFAFSTIGSTGWTNSYASHTVNVGTVATVYFSNSSKQTSNVTAYPVTKAGPITLVLTDNTQSISSVTFNAVQWTTKTKTMILKYSTNGGTSYSAFSPAVSSSLFTVTASSIPAGTNAIELSFSESSNQVGIQSVSFTISGGCTKKLTINKGAESHGTFTLSQSGELASCSAISTVVTPTPANHYHVSAVTATTPTAGGAPTVSAPDSEGKYTVTYAANSTGSSTINVAFAEDAHATITTSVAGSSTTDADTYYVGDTYTLPSSVAAGVCGTKVLVGWSTVPVATTNTKPTANFYEKGAEVTLDANQTFYAVFADESISAGSTKSDLLDRSSTEATGTSYVDWSNVSGSASSAVYAGNSAGGNSSIQLRSSNAAGIVSTTSGGKVKRVAVNWNSNTQTDRVLNIYGSNSAYTDAGDLYTSSDQGTLLGTITYASGQPTEINVSGNYAYVGIRSSSGALYLNSVTIDWSTSSTTYSNYSTTCVTYDVDVVVNNTAFGAANYALGLITATPAAGYRVKAGTEGYTILQGTVTVFNNGDNTFSVNATSDCRIQVNFELIPTFTVNWYVAGIIQHHQTAEEGAVLTGIPTPDKSDCDGEKVFVGWYNNTYSGDVAPAGLITNTAGLTMPAADINYYAVFAETIPSATSFKRVTALSELASASKIVIVAYNGQKTLDANFTADVAELSEDLNYCVTPAETNIFTLEKSGDDYRIKNSNGYVGIGAIPESGSTVYMNYTNNNSVWSIGVSTKYTNTFYIKNTAGNASIEYYSGWKVYGTASYASTSAIACKLYVPSLTYTGYTTTCTPCSINPNWSFATSHAIVMKGVTSYTNVINKSYASSGLQTWTSSDEAVATVDENGVVTPLIPGTAIITLKLGRKDDICAQTLSYEFEVRDPTLEIVEVKQLEPDSFGIIIEHDLPGAATITLSVKEEHNTGSGSQADSLFFSKYFEAAANVKLLAIYNGTDHDIDISDYGIAIAQSSGAACAFSTTKFENFLCADKEDLNNTYSLTPAQMILEKGKEIIIITYTASGSDPEIVKCAKNDSESGFENYIRVKTPNLQFNGDDAVALVNPQGNFIDLIGAGTKTGGKNVSAVVKVNTSDGDVNGFMDNPGGWYSAHGTQVGTNVENYALSTDRCLLIRKNTVTSGLNAVEKNTNTFFTLGDSVVLGTMNKGEWLGLQIAGPSTPSTAPGVTNSCAGFGYVGKFDYSSYYVTYDTITKDQILDDIKQPDGTYLIPVPKMKDRACGELKVEIRGAGNTLLNEKQFRVPIIVDANITTDDARFNAKKDTCKTCDVIVMNGATLTKIDDNNSHWGDTAYNVDIYAGGKLVVPASKEYRANNVTMRTCVADDGLNMIVPEVVVDGNIVHAMHGLSQRIRVGTNRFYAFSVPFEVRLSDISFSSGEPAVFGTDYMIRVYDGESRAASQVASGNWKNFTGDRLLPGHGYTIALAKRDGHAYRELILPMYGATLVDGEAPFKNQTVFAWGWNTGARANHIGWNYVGNPYLRKYAKNNLNGDAQLKLTIGALVPDPDNDGWYINDGGSVPYVTQINADRSDYSQHLVSATDLPPFTPFFIQVGVDGQSAGDDVLLSYVREHRVTAAPARRNAQIVSSALVSVLLQGNETEDNFGVVVGDNYTPDYDMMADLSKEFGSAYSLKAYTLQDADQMRMAFNAVNTERVTQSIPVGVRLPAQGQYTFLIDPSIDLSAFEHIFLTDNLTGYHTDLMDEVYRFNVNAKQQVDNRFALTVILKPKAMPTACEENWAEHVFAEGRDGRLRLSRLPAHAHVYIYDVSGRLMADRQFTSESNYSWPLQVGVYEVRVVADGKSELIKTIVK